MAILIDFLLISILIISALAFLRGLFVLLFRSPRKRGFKILGISFVVIIIAAATAGTLHDQRAKDAGFVDAADKRLAKEFGYTSADRWNQDRHTVLSKHEAQSTQQAGAEQSDNPEPETQNIQERTETTGSDSAVQQANAQTKQSKR